MNKFKNILIASFALLSTGAFAGNNDRAGSSGANELLINPWARSSGWMGCNTSNVRGVEAQWLNVAGTAFTKKTEIGFTHTTLYKGSDISINTAGLSVKSGESSVLTLGVSAFDFNDILVTTPEQPEGGLGTYSPQFINIGLSYAKGFSRSIYGGATARIIYESISDASAQGFAIDAGIQYVTGFNEAKDNLKFGIALKNIGAPMKFKGEAFSFRSTTSNGTSLTVQQRTEKLEVPSLINIGASYDFTFTEMHRITLSGTFTSNSFTKDQTAIGAEYAFKKLFMVRAGYAFEQKKSEEDESTSAFTGLGAGLTVELPLGKSGKALGLDYSYRDTNPFDGTHSFGLIFKL